MVRSLFSIIFSYTINLTYEYELRLQTQMKNNSCTYSNTELTFRNNAGNGTHLNIEQIHICNNVYKKYF